MRIKIPSDPTLRTLIFSNFVNTFGNGLWRTLEVIFFSIYLGFGAHQVAVALSVAGAVGLIFSIPIGYLADRFGPRGLAILGFIGEGLILLCYLTIKSYSFFLILTILDAVVATLSMNMRMAIIGRMGEGEERTRIRAISRVVTNLGIACGTVFAGIALGIGTATAFKTMLILDAASFFVSALIFRNMPSFPATISKHDGFSFEVFRNQKFMTAITLHSLFVLHFVIQSVALPLWIIKMTNAPRWTVSLVMLINTIYVVLFQVRAARGVTTVAQGGRAYLKANTVIALSCIVYSLSSNRSAVVATFILVLGMLLHVYGEVIGSVGASLVGFGLAEPTRVGQFMGIWSMGNGLSSAIGPAFVTWLVIGNGSAGWYVLALIFLLTGIAINFLVRNIHTSG